MQVKVDVLICVCGLSEDVKGEGAIRIAFDVYIKQLDGALYLLLLCPSYIWVDAIDVGEEALGMILVDRNEGVIRLTQPKKDGVVVRKGG